MTLIRPRLWTRMSRVTGPDSFSVILFESAPSPMNDLPTVLPLTMVMA